MIPGSANTQFVPLCDHIPERHQLSTAVAGQRVAISGLGLREIEQAAHLAIDEVDDRHWDIVISERYCEPFAPSDHPLGDGSRPIDGAGRRGCRRLRA